MALQFLYTLDLRKGEGIEQLDEFLREEPCDSETGDYAKRLIFGVREKIDEIDRRIQATAKNWDLHRMATIDRNILRMSVYEILNCEDIPAKVSINEAIDLGKKFSTANSGAFINGILDKIRIEKEG